MSCSVFTSPVFDREFKRLAKRYKSLSSDFARLVESIKANPIQGYDLGDGLRKIRMSVTSKGKGKSGGARVITYNVVSQVDDQQVLMLIIYDKSERASISKREILAMKHMLGV